MKKTLTAFSLIEILIGILIISAIMVSAFTALSSVWVGKIKLIERTNIEKQSYYMAEKFFEMVKKWGTLDYEEYWNRTSFNTTFGSGHYLNNTGFWNDGTYYVCMSKNGLIMPDQWCLRDFNISASWSELNFDRVGTKQLYNQYSRQFIDYNGDADNDNGDEDNSWETNLNFAWDDDDLYLGQWPSAFIWSKVGELYLISSDKTQRTFFRWNVRNDPYAPPWSTCTGTENMIGEGCLGTIELLKLSWIDNGYDHGIYAWNPEGWWDDADGEIDTWLIQKDFNPVVIDVLAWFGSINYWQKVFPDTMNVMNVEFHAFPNKSINYAWKESDSEYQIAPYIQVKMTLSPSWQEKRKIKGKVPSVDFITTISLIDLDLR